jgi:hypothetical protein
MEIIPEGAGSDDEVDDSGGKQSERKFSMNILMSSISRARPSSMMVRHFGMLLLACILLVDDNSLKKMKDHADHSVVRNTCQMKYVVNNE